MLCRLNVRLFLTLCIALIAASALAQFQTGNIYGKVQAKDGSVLPGVTVTLTGVGAPQTIITGAQGEFRFANLSPGMYSLRAELEGFGSASRSGVGVRVGANADVTITLNPSVTESITVTGEAPLLDVRKAGTAINVTKVELEKVPTSRDPWTILQQAPAVLVDRMNVGGNQSGQQSNYIGKGAAPGQNTWNVDGVNITDEGATGSSPTYYDFDSFEEMQVTTGGSDPRIMTPGVQLNMVTKRGTNDFRGSSRYFYTPGKYQSDASVPSEAGSGSFKDVFINSKWSTNITGLYQLPWDFSLGASLSARHGYPKIWRDEITVDNGVDDVVLNKVGSVRFPNVYELDLRAARDFRIMNRFGITLSADLFNLPNKRTVLQRETLLFSDSSPSPVGNQIEELQSPRIWRFGARINF